MGFLDTVLFLFFVVFVIAAFLLSRLATTPQIIPPTRSRKATNKMILIGRGIVKSVYRFFRDVLGLSTVINIATEFCPLARMCGGEKLIECQSNGIPT